MLDLISFYSVKNDQGEVSYHAKRIPRDLKLDFGRLPQWRGKNVFALLFFGE